MLCTHFILIFPPPAPLRFNYIVFLLFVVSSALLILLHLRIDVYLYNEWRSRALNMTQYCHHLFAFCFYHSINFISHDLFSWHVRVPCPVSRVSPDKSLRSRRRQSVRVPIAHVGWVGDQVTATFLLVFLIVSSSPTRTWIDRWKETSITTSRSLSNSKFNEWKWIS